MAEVESPRGGLAREGLSRLDRNALELSTAALYSW
jgi:hypothetical protein